VDYLFLVRSVEALGKTIKYGDEHVPLLERQWRRRRAMTPYYRTDLLKPGESWRNAPVRGKYTEHYVQLGDGPIPVGVAIARELRDEGASVAVCTDLTLGELRLIDPDLFCIEPPALLLELLKRLQVANDDRWAGLPDAIGIFPDGRVAFREAKVAKKDRLNKPQHDFARVARRVLGDKLDLAAVEWGYEAADES
jgi:hypothetical protein